MIQNEHQLRVTQHRIQQFETSLEALDQASSLSPRAKRVQRAAVESVLEDLRSEVAAYRHLHGSGRVEFDFGNVERLPEALVEGRVAAGLSQQELGELVGLSKQQISLYERTRYAGASYARIVEISQAITARLELPQSAD